MLTGDKCTVFADGEAPCRRTPATQAVLVDEDLGTLGGDLATEAGQSVVPIQLVFLGRLDGVYRCLSNSYCGHVLARTFLSKHTNGK